MQAEALSFAVRERAPWEAVDLGVALTRTHARLIWSVWGLVSVPIAALCCGFSYLIDAAWLGALLIWWLKPVYDRIPLYVLSRAVLGATPGFTETLRAQWHWGWRGIVPWLLWRRLHPGRCLLLAVDLLEQPHGARRSERVRVVSAVAGTPQTWLTIVGVHLEMMLMASLVVLGLMFVPVEFLDDSAKAVFDAVFEHPPAWLDAAYNGVYWLALSLFEPFYVGAGFALYLNRRSQLEAWDIELAFRRLARRLMTVASSLLLGLGLVLAAGLSEAADVERADVPTLAETLGEHHQAAESAYAAEVKKALADPLLSPKETIERWQRRKPLDQGEPAPLPAWLDIVAGMIGFVVEHALWIVLALVLLFLLLNHRRWLDWWQRHARAPAPPAPRPALLLAQAEPLPDDLAAAVERLWQAGDARAALALLYRGALARLSELLGSPLPPGATEAECLRLARRLGAHAYVDLFAHIVRGWQAAAYAQRLPDAAELRELLERWRQPPEAAS